MAAAQLYSLPAALQCQAVQTLRRCRPCPYHCGLFLCPVAHIAAFCYPQGYLVGNGCTDQAYDGNAQVPFAVGKSLISTSLYRRTQAACGGSYWDVKEGSRCVLFFGGERWVCAWCVPACWLRFGLQAATQRTSKCLCVFVKGGRSRHLPVGPSCDKHTTAPTHLSRSPTRGFQAVSSRYAIF